MDNRRQFDRERVRATVQVLAPFPLWGEMVDLGPGGFCLELETDLPVGERVVLRVLGHGRIFEMAPATVRWVRASSTGFLIGLCSEEFDQSRHLAA